METNYSLKMVAQARGHYRLRRSQRIDTYGKKLATELNLKCKEFKPDYKKDGRGAPLKRNTLIFENSDFVAAFPMCRIPERRSFKRHGGLNKEG